MTIWCEELPVTVFTPDEREAIRAASKLDPWLDIEHEGEGTALVLSRAALDEKISLPPAAMFPVYRSGLCIHGYSPRLLPLLKLVGGSHLAWWGWPKSEIALMAAGWQYQRAIDDPLIQEVLFRLVGQPLSIQVTVFPLQPASIIMAQVLEELLRAGYART
jgi:hypothetical protein